MPTTSHRKFKHPSLVAAAAAAVNCLAERKIDVWPASSRRGKDPLVRTSWPACSSDLGASIANAISSLASALRHLQQPDPIPALRPIRTALRAATTGADAALLSVTDRLVDAIDTLDAILRANLAPL
jgi:hypothetical protein